MVDDAHITLITGASGFLGSHLVRHLSAQGHSVRALYNSTLPSDELRELKGVDWQQADLLDIFDVERVMEGVSKVYHCAAIVSFAPKDKERMVHFNIEATKHIVNECIERGISRIVYVSSVAALGRNAEAKEITEEEQWEESKYNSTYAYSKHRAELEVWRGVGEGLHANIVCPGVILGEGNWEVGSANLLKVVAQEFPFYTDGVNSFVDVKDVVKAMYLLMEGDVQDERFILSAGNFPYKRIFTLMARQLGVRPPHIHASRWMTELVWRWKAIQAFITGKQHTITKETAATAQRKTYYNNTKLPQYIPDFQYTAIEDTIGRMAEAYKAQKVNE
ncbi:MAG: NAD-dependent epimerase/dehydratase family protein [Flavipsychrobacter sp.]